MNMDKEKDREMELESVMYTNCLLLGMDPNIIATPSGTTRVGLFRHSNPKLGEQLLFFILSSLRGPVQSAKDFDKVWPIFDSAQSRDFRKVVQSIITELESQGALPRSNSRVSSLATCCGPRFVELLWQLSLHALREVHRRTFATDVAANPLPAPLTDVSFQHAAALLPITKARIALDRRRFLKNAETAVQRQAMWSNMAQELTEEFRSLCAEEAFLQQELEKLYDLQNQVKLEGKQWEELVSDDSENSHLVSKATSLWDSLLAHKSQHEVLASGPVEDLIAHREHRYRICGSTLLSAMDQSSDISYSYSNMDKKEPSDASSYPKLNSEMLHGGSNPHHPLLFDDKYSRVDDRGGAGRGPQTVDVAEIIRRWTHALRCVHKQALQLTKTNDGQGPDILRNSIDGCSGGHAITLAATLAEHEQHLTSLQVLIDQLKEASPAVQKSISECTKKVNCLSSSMALASNLPGRADSPLQNENILERSLVGVVDVSSKMAAVQLDQPSMSPSAAKLPRAFSSNPTLVSQTCQIENPSQGVDNSYIEKLKRSVRESALATAQSSRSDSPRDAHFDGCSEHFFMPLLSTGLFLMSPEKKMLPVRTKTLLMSQKDSVPHKNSCPDYHAMKKCINFSDVGDKVGSSNDHDHVLTGFLSASPSHDGSCSKGEKFLFDGEQSLDLDFSPPLLIDSSLFSESYEDLLAPLSDMETALMEH